jgi:intracellular proteinase inhibitor BsuPI
MLNYPAMKSLRGLLLTLLFFPLPGWAQGVRMSADFLPLEVGKSWIYDVTNEAGQKVGQIGFEVEEYTIVSGASFYVLSEFPFSPETGEPIRFVRYDRDERSFIRKARNAEGPLFLNDGSATEVIEADAAGAPQKFILRMDKMALTFQRGVGIVEAKMEKSGSTVTAKLVSASAKPTAGTAAAPGPGPARVPAADKNQVLIPPPVVTNRRESPVATVTSQNPRVDVLATPTPDGFQIVMVVINVSDKILPFRFGSGQTYDFLIHDAVSGKEVWKWSSGNLFTQVVRSDSIRAQGKWQFEVTWNRKDNEDRPLPAGQYRLTGIVTSLPAVRSGPVLLDLR